MNLIRTPFARFGLSLAAVGAGLLLRQLIERWTGPGLPTYIIFYPAVMLAALLAGFWPGIMATLAIVLVSDYFLLEPQHDFGVEKLVDVVGLILFAGMGVLMSAVAGLYRRIRSELGDLVAERTRELHDANSALKQQVELVDPARAEVIMQEMQRVARARLDAAVPRARAMAAGDRLPRAATVAGAAVAVMGLLALIGWAFGVGYLLSFLPGLATMKANTALCFVLAGAALALRGRRMGRVACAAAVCAMGALTLLEYVSGADFGIDQVLFPDPGNPQTVYLGRMVPATALGFLLSGASLLLLGMRTRAGRWAQQALAVITGVLGIVATLGYIYDVQPLYRFAGPASMALHTALGFVALSVGLIFARRDGLGRVLTASGPGAQAARRLLPAAILLPVFLGWLHELGERSGIFAPTVGASLLVLVMMLSFVAVIWWIAQTLERADAARREVETQLRNQFELMDHSREALIVGEMNGAIRFWNNGAVALYGWPAAEALGQRIHVLLRTEGLPPDHEARLEQSGHWEGELIHTARDGSRVIVESRKTAMRAADGRLLILESNRDITGRKKAEEAVLEATVQKRAAQYSRTLIEVSPDPLVTISPEGKIADVNEATIKATGTPREELVGTNFSDYFTEPRKADEGYERVFAQGYVTDYPLTIRRRDGHLTDVLYNASLYRDRHGIVQGVFAAARDVTAQKRAEAELKRHRDTLEVLVKERTAQLEASNRNLARSNENLEQFAYVASHDLQEPLRIMASYSQLLEKRYKTRLDQDADEFIGYIVDSAARMQKLIMDLLAYSRAGHQDVDLAEVDCGQIVRRVVESMGATIESAGGSVTLDELPVIQAHEAGMIQVFQNLIGNALKFRGEEPPRIHVSAREGNNEWVFSVRDNGVGIEPQYFDRIFVIFQRLHSRDKYAGTGIGLSICKKIVENLGGRIWVESEAGKGSTFFFTAPEARVKND